MKREKSYLSNKGVTNRCASPLGAFLHVPCRIAEYTLHSHTGASLILCWIWSSAVWCKSLRTCVGCRHSSGQSRYCGGHPRLRKAGCCPHPSLRKDTLLAPVAGQAGAHARTGAVRWRRWKRGALFWQLGVVSILWMVQCILIGGWIIGFSIHAVAGPPWQGGKCWSAA